MIGDFVFVQILIIDNKSGKIKKQTY